MRLCIKKTKNKTFYYALDARREGNKIVSNVAMRIGEHSELASSGVEDPLAYAKAKVAELNAERKSNKLSVNETYDFSLPIGGDGRKSDSTVRNVGWLYARRVIEGLGLKEFLDGIDGRHKYDLAAITEYYVVNRVLFPGSKRKAFLSRGQFFGAPDYGLHDGYRALDPLDDHNDELQKSLFEGTKSLVELDMSVLYYDCTNLYFECEEQDDNEYDEDGDIIQWGLRRYGASKEHRPNPIVQMGLFTDGNGIPISYCVHHGCNNEQNTAIPLESRMVRDYGHSRFIYCSDGGLGSYDNRFFNTMQGRDYVVAQSLKKTAESELECIFKDMNWRYAGGGGKVSLSEFKRALDKQYEGGQLTEKERAIIAKDMIWKPYPMKRKVPAKFLKGIKLSGTLTMEETVYVTFSAKYYLYQRRLLDRQVATAERWIKERDPESIMKGENDVRRLIKSIKATKDGEIADVSSCSIDESRVAAERRFHGFYAVATSLKGKDIGEIMGINASRWMIEQSFRLLKSDFDARPVFASTPKHIRAHIAICYIALLVYRIIESKLNSQGSERFTSSEILSTMRNMGVIELGNGSVYQAAYTGSAALDALEKAYPESLDKKYYSKKALAKKFGEGKK